MSSFFTLLSFFSLLIFAAWLHLYCSLPAALAPLVTACALMLWFSFWGCLGLLAAAGWICFLLALAALVDLIRRSDSRFWKSFFCPGVLLFCLASLGVIFLFSLRKPLFLEWDEFSFWGTAAKLVKQNDELYTTAKIGWAWTATQKPGLIVFSYFFQFFGVFEEWRVMAALDVLQFAVFGALLAPLTRRQWACAVPATAAAFLVPAVLVLYRALDVPSNLYMSAHSDIPMGVLFAGVFAVAYGCNGERKNLRWPTLVTLAALTLTRDTALPLALIAAAAGAADWAFCTEQKRTLRSRFFDVAKALAVPLCCFLGWALYLALRVNVNALEVTTDGSMGMGEMLLRGISELLGIGRTEKFSRVMGMMVKNFFCLKMTALGSGAVVAACILVLVGISWLCADERLLRRRCALFALLSTLGFVAFYVFTGLCYVYIFKDIESANLTGYERYVYPYYIGWMLCALYLLCSVAARQSKRFYGAAQGTLLALLLLLGWRAGRIITPQMSFIDYPEGYDSTRQVSQRQAQRVQDLIDGDEEQTIFFVSQGDDGREWFLYCYELLPCQLDYSFGGGTLADPALLAEGQNAIEMTPPELCSYLDKKGCAYLFIRQSDQIFKASYGALFTDGLAACEDGGAVYKIKSGSSTMQFELVGEVAP